MTNTELIEALRYCSGDGECEGCSWRAADMLCLERLVKAAADALEKAEKAEPKWIAVEERLPEEWEPVLAMVYIDDLLNKSIIETMWFIGNIDGRNRWKVCWNGDMVESDVTHWMPLPGYHPDCGTKMDEEEEK